MRTLHMPTLRKQLAHFKMTSLQQKLFHARASVYATNTDLEQAATNSHRLGKGVQGATCQAYNPIDCNKRRA
jgi:hypothetical protein